MILLQQGSYTVLIADDEAVIRNGLTKAIPWDKYGARVIGTAANGQEALSMVLTHRPDLAVIDIKMPLMDGLEVIRRAGENGVETRFIILSGYDDFALAQKAIRYGARSYFLKPLKIEEFKDELSRQLQEISARRSSRSDTDFEMLIRSSRVFFLNQLILNELRSQEEIDRRASMVRLDWLHRQYRVLVTSAAGAPSAAFAEAQTLVHALLAGVDHELWLHGGDMLVGIVGGDDSAFAATKAALPGLTAELRSRTGLRFYASVGKTVQGPENAATAYTSALRALSYHLYEVPGDVYDDNMVCRQEPPAGLTDVQWETLIDAMDQADTECLHSFCRRYVDGLFFVAMPPPDFIRGMCMHLVSNARIRFLSRHSDISPVAPLSPEELRHCHSVGGLCAWMERQLLALVEQYRRQRDAEDPIIRRAKEFIREHISENIKARDVAADVNLSESYFTVYFKQKTGENFRDYQLAVRMELARSLLSEGRLSVGEIAAAAGYQDYRSFSRAFKNVTGVSPSEYHHP